jgi:hypothetical protein
MIKVEGLNKYQKIEEQKDDMIKEWERKGCNLGNKSS